MHNLPMAVPQLDAAPRGYMRSLGRWLLLVLSVCAFLLLAVENGAYWLWVGASALFGIRAKMNLGLGVLAVAAALVPMGLGLLVWRRASGADSSRVLGLAGAFAVAAAASIPPIVLSAYLLVI